MAAVAFRRRWGSINALNVRIQKAAGSGEASQHQVRQRVAMRQVVCSSSCRLLTEGGLGLQKFSD
jgi:hypothetical protein